MFLLMLLALASPAATQAAGLEPEREIRYISTDGLHVAVFSKDGARFGPDLALSPGIWPASPAEYLEPSPGIRCVSMGPRGAAQQLAIKRPIKAGESYQCMRTSFRVLRCFDECRSAVVRVATPLSGGRRGHLRAYMYVDSCLGLLAYSQTGNRAKGMKLDAVWLRGDVGILSDRECRR
jgi:hypothetical protein